MQFVVLEERECGKHRGGMGVSPGDSKLEATHLWVCGGLEEGLGLSDSVPHVVLRNAGPGTTGALETCCAPRAMKLGKS